MSIDGIIIFYIIFGFFAFCMIVAVAVMYWFYRRRKLIFTNFLSETGQWERKEWMPNKIEKHFEYDGHPYEYDIKLCTRDSLNRPIAHYYKGNPKQQLFLMEKGNKSIVIGTNEITGKDFRVLMLSKVLRDIFADGEVQGWLLLILIAVVVVGVGLGIMIYTHDPKIVLKADNETISTIAQGVRLALQRG